MLFALLLACTTPTTTEDTATTRDTGPLLYQCECHEPGADGYCGGDGAYRLTCDGGDIGRCERQCANQEDPCCALLWAEST